MLNKRTKAFICFKIFLSINATIKYNSYNLKINLRKYP